MSNNPTAEKTISTLLGCDSLGVAEAITGKSYKTDEETSSLGVAIHLRKTQVLRDALKAAGDTFYSMPMEQSIDIFKKAGFVQVFQTKFDGRRGVMNFDDLKEESYTLFAHADGYIIALESYCGKTVNSATLYFIIGSEELDKAYAENAWNFPCSRCPISLDNKKDGRVDFACDMDIREAFLHKFSHLQEKIAVKKQWERHHLWLTHRIDFEELKENQKNNSDFSFLNNLADKRLAEFPEPFKSQFCVARDRF